MCVDICPYIRYGMDKFDQNSGFDWDAGNCEKCQAHGLSTEDIEAVIRGAIHVAPDVAHSAAESRFLGVVQSLTGRYVFVAFTMRQINERRLIRPISARFMHLKEVRHYDSQIKKAETVADPSVRSSS